MLLNANISFLSIQSIDNNGNLVAKRSLTQIVSYISMVTSLGSVLLAMLLVRQNRSKGREAADKAVSAFTCHFLVIWQVLTLLLIGRFPSQHDT